MGNRLTICTWFIVVRQVSLRYRVVEGGLRIWGLYVNFKGGNMSIYTELLFWLSIGFAAGVIAYLYRGKGKG